jgi:regulator of cell morphogenesis and NO signaling
MFTAESTLGSIIVEHPALAGVFELLELDYGCGGKQTLSAACRARGLDPVATLAALESAAADAQADPALADTATMSLTVLADHIEETHHAYVKRELPALLGQSRRLVAVHGDRDSLHAKAATAVAALAEEMLMHMAMEEQVLFPLIRQLDRGDGSARHCGTVANPIRVMELEHEHADGAVHHLRTLTRGFTPALNSCETHRTFLAGLARFEQDLHEHVHKENNILFPRALAREVSLMSRSH